MSQDPGHREGGQRQVSRGERFPFAAPDAEAFTRFYRRHSVPVLGYLVGCCSVALVSQHGSPEYRVDLTKQTGGLRHVR